MKFDEHSEAPRGVTVTIETQGNLMVFNSDDATEITAIASCARHAHTLIEGRDYPGSKYRLFQTMMLDLEGACLHELETRKP